MAGGIRDVTRARDGEDHGDLPRPDDDDADHGRSVRTLAVASPDGVDFFVASAAGAATPLRSIRGAATTLQHACALAVLGSELFVADSSAETIDVWDLAASGDVAPTRQITTTFAPISLAANGASIYVGASDGVRVFDATASGAAVPTQTIAGSLTTIASGAGIAIYQSELYVVSQGGSAAVFPTAANGNAPPPLTLAGVNPGLATPVAVAVGFGLEFVTDATAPGSVQIFFPASVGNHAEPAQTISGNLPQLATPTSLAIADTMLFVGTPSTSSIERVPDDHERRVSADRSDRGRRRPGDGDLQERPRANGGTMQDGCSNEVYSPSRACWPQPRPRMRMIPRHHRRRRAKTPFDRGRFGLSLGGGTQEAFGVEYVAIGGGVGYFVLDGVELGLSALEEFGSGPNIAKLSPSLRYLAQPLVGHTPVIPYVGVFYNHWFISGDNADLDSVGARAGGVHISGSLLLGLGVAVERYVSTCSTDCVLIYPDFTISLAM